jgi:GNAT superfamily N-acetyltransferase
VANTSNITTSNMAGDKPVIVAAQAEDVPAIFRLIRALAEYERLSHEVVATEESLRLHLFGPKPAAEAILAKLNGEPIGFALYFQTFSTFRGVPGLWLEDLFVLPEFRRMGIGKLLLREVALIAHQRNCGRLEWSVLDWNTPAVNFYRKIGAAAMTDWTIQRFVGDQIKQLMETLG